jgi:hypothetical protein
MVCLLGGRAHAYVSAAAIKGWLRLHIANCVDVRAVVAWIGEAKAVEMAREAGATEKQINDARRCLRN